MNGDAVAAGLAARQQGMVTTEQLLGAGLKKQAITRCVESGWLVRRYQGVYQLGVFAGPFGADAAALLACGPDAVISHHTAAGLWRLLERQPDITSRRREA